MDATRQLTSNIATAFMICVAISFIWLASVIPYSRRLLYVVVPCTVSIAAWVIIIILVMSELPMKRRGWMSIYQRMVDIAGISIIVGLGSVCGIGLGLI